MFLLKKGKPRLVLHKQEWDLIRDLMDILQLVEVAMSQLSGEQFATLSLALHLVYGLFEQLCPQEEDRSTVASLKAHLHKQLATRFHLEDVVKDPLPLLSCALDPRFRRLSFLPVHIKE